MRFALPAAALAAAIIPQVWAQQAPASGPIQNMSPAGPTASQAMPRSVASSPSPVLPTNIVVELKGPPEAKVFSGLGVAIITALGAFAVAAYNAWRLGSTERMKALTQESLEEMKTMAADDLQRLRLAFEAAQAEARRIAEQAKEDVARDYDREKQAAIHAHDKQKEDVNRILQKGQHQDKIALEMRALQLRANVSDAEAYMAVQRLEHERNMAQANLVNTFFGKLLSESQRERDLALFALSAFVDPARLAQLAVGGEAIISRESLSRLAANGTDEVATAAQEVLNAGVGAFRSGVVRVHSKGNARMSANGFICDGNVVVTYAVFRKDEVFEVHTGEDGAKAEAICVAVDDAHFLAAGWVRTGLGGRPLPLRGTPVRPNDTHVRVAQWNDDRFIVRAGMVVAIETKPRLQYALGESGEVADVINLRVLSESGSAGAPVLDEDGSVVGMIISGEPGYESSRAAPASAIKAMLANAHAVRTTLAAGLVGSNQAS